MIDKIIADKIKKKQVEPMDVHEFRKSIVYSRFTKKDASMLIREMKHKNLITIRRNRVWVR